jgi:F-type H+-transporting ATPase subunit epsilon
MKLLITTPTAVVVDEPDVVSVRAEDESGGFGILPGHTDLLTVLSISVVSWKQADEVRRYCAVRRGVLTVTGGDRVSIATRQALVGSDLANLESVVLSEFRNAAEVEQSARSDAMKLQMRAIRQIVRLLRPASAGMVGDGQ